MKKNLFQRRTVKQQHGLCIQSHKVEDSLRNTKRNSPILYKLFICSYEDIFVSDLKTD